jgi:C1A family cysteine protease
MKKIVLYLIFFCFLIPQLNAQSGITPKTMLKSKVPPGDPDISLGYRAPPIKIHFHARPKQDMRYKSSSALPSKFDLRDEGRVTAAKDQNPGGGIEPSGNCAAFSTIGALESRWLTMGLGEFDLSEQNLAACSGFEWGYGQGGNQFTCSAYITRFDGPVLESEDAYIPELPFCRDYLNPVAFVPESRWLPVRDFELLKHTVYYYGAVYAGIYWDVTGQSFRAGDNTYHYSGDASPNHAVLVCGWDDSKETAGGTGAWIVKNSWGTGWAEEGFFYISYQDTRFAGDEVAHYPVRWEKDEIDTTYIWDNLGFTAKSPAINISKVHELALFTAPSRQLVTHIGVCVADPESVLDIYVYDDFEDDELSNLMASRENIYIEIPGIYTFELPVIVDGDFYVKVTREIGEGDVNHPIEAYDEGFSDPAIEKDVNWVRREGAAKWVPTDLTNFGIDCNLTIRAYARKTDAPAAIFMADKKDACLGSEVTFTYLENNPATAYVWDFGKDASPATATTKGPHKVTYSSEGTKTVSLVVSGTGGADTVIRHDYVDVLPDIRVNILQDTMAFQQGKTVEVSAWGADSYEWSPAAMVDVDTGQTVLATPPYEGTHILYVNGTQGSCSATDSVVLQTTNKPENDDMCDAMLIKPGGWIADHSNQFATAEEGEPAPDDTDCHGALTWCVDDWGPTVTNSLWYYFYGPETRTASIRTRGFDNQIAVYKADSCQNIIKDSLIAANDDYGSNLWAQLDAVSVTPGAKYYLQIDGSFGGVKGVTTLFFYAYPTGGEEEAGAGSASPSLRVYPNPGEDIFNVRLNGTRSERVEVILYNLNGQLIMKKTFENVPGELLTRLDLSGHSSGVYHLRVRTGGRILDRKLVKQ